MLAMQQQQQLRAPRLLEGVFHQPTVEEASPQAVMWAWEDEFGGILDTTKNLPQAQVCLLVCVTCSGKKNYLFALFVNVHTYFPPPFVCCAIGGGLVGQAWLHWPPPPPTVAGGGVRVQLVEQPPQYQNCASRLPHSCHLSETLTDGCTLPPLPFTHPTPPSPQC